MRSEQVSEAGELSCAEYYQFIKQQIDHQDNLVNQRVIWQIIAQAFFFGAYATLMNAPKEAKGPLFDAEQRLLLWVLPMAGLLAGLLTYVGIVSSLKTIGYLRKLYDEYSHGKAPTDPSSRLYPPMQGPSHLRRWASVAPILMPIVFALTWVVVLGRLILAVLA
jgi:hypothetical protein